MPVVDLTIDASGAVAGLNKYDKAVSTSAKKTDSAFTKMRGAAGSIATAIGVGVVAAFAAATAAVVTFATSMLEAGEKAREIENLSRLAKLNVVDFQAAAKATEKYGINAEALGDISKDVSDKVGDFIATGGGEFADFFENVAPKVGLTAEALQKLSGPDALIAVKKAMDDANVSMGEQIFYLESLGNDVSKLIPLLENGGAAFLAQANAAKELGLVLNQWDIDRLKEGQESVKKILDALVILKDKVLANLAPIFTEFANRLETAFKESGVTIDDVAEIIADKLVGAFTFAIQAVQFFDNAVRGLKLAANFVIVAFAFMAKSVINLLKTMATPLSLLIEGLNALGADIEDPFIALKETSDDFYASAVEGLANTWEGIENSNKKYEYMIKEIKSVAAAEKARKKAVEDSTAAINKQANAATSATIASGGVASGGLSDFSPKGEAGSYEPNAKGVYVQTQSSPTGSVADVSDPERYQHERTVINNTFTEQISKSQVESITTDQSRTEGRQ